MLEEKEREFGFAEKRSKVRGEMGERWERKREIMSRDRKRNYWEKQRGRRGRVSKGKKVFWVRIKKGIRINQSQRDISGMSFFSPAYISGT